MPQRQVRAPDGREWVVTGHGRRVFPPWRAVNPHSTSRISDTPFLYRLIGDIVIGALIFPLIVWVIELPFSIIRSFAPAKTVVEAKDKSKPPVTMRWRLDGGSLDDAVGEVAKQLEAGAQSIALPNATYLA